MISSFAGYSTFQDELNTQVLWLNSIELQLNVDKFNINTGMLMMIRSVIKLTLRKNNLQNVQYYQQFRGCMILLNPAPARTYRVSFPLDRSSCSRLAQLRLIFH